MGRLDLGNLNPDELRLKEALSRGAQSMPMPIPIAVIEAENPDGSKCRIYQSAVCLEEELGDGQVALYLSNGMVLVVKPDNKKMLCLGVYPSPKEFSQRSVNG